jgi:hypothetical protein
MMITLKIWTRYEDNIKVSVNDTGCEIVDWIRFVECMKTWRILGDTLTDVPVPISKKNCPAI